MKPVRYTDHLKVRLAIRRIPDELPRKIFRNADARYLDEATNHMIAVGHARYGGERRGFMIAYDIIGAEVEVITIHPITEEQIRARTRSRRWRLIEKNASKINL